MKSRSLVLVPIAALAIAAFAGPALAGTDGDDANGGPVTTPAPVPFVQPPAAAPVAAATPAPPPPAATTEKARAPREAASKAKRQPRTRTVAAQRPAHHRAVHTRTRTRTRTQALRTATVPRGGVQAGAGGTA
jgi:hypothetical protein